MVRDTANRAGGTLAFPTPAWEHFTAALRMEWRKSTYSTGDGGNCVETASHAGTVMVRDTANRAGGTLVIAAPAWKRFTATLR
jgi:Domain of unknown function (DUF397)